MLLYPFAANWQHCIQYYAQHLSWSSMGFPSLHSVYVLRVSCMAFLVLLHCKLQRPTMTYNGEAALSHLFSHSFRLTLLQGINGSKHAGIWPSAPVQVLFQCQRPSLCSSMSSCCLLCSTCHFVL